jgi:Leucine-rich repeat (LRR) protein
LYQLLTIFHLKDIIQHLNHLMILSRKVKIMNHIVTVVFVVGFLSQYVLSCWAADVNLEQEKAVAEITKIGGRVGVDEKMPGKPVISLSLRDTKVTDAGLEILKALPNLQSLDLTNTKITEYGLKNLKELTKIHTLDLSVTEVNDAGLEHVEGMINLRSLILGVTKITDAGLAHINGLTNLQKLNLEGTQVTDAGLEQLKALINLRELNLSNTKVTDESMKKLQKALPRCKIIH